MKIYILRPLDVKRMLHVLLQKRPLFMHFLVHTCVHQYICGPSEAVTKLVQIKVSDIVLKFSMFFRFLCIERFFLNCMMVRLLWYLFCVCLWVYFFFLKKHFMSSRDSQFIQKATNGNCLKYIFMPRTVLSNWLQYLPIAHKKIKTNSKQL